MGFLQPTCILATLAPINNSFRYRNTKIWSYIWVLYRGMINFTCHTYPTMCATSYIIKYYTCLLLWDVITHLLFVVCRMARFNVDMTTPYQGVLTLAWVLRVIMGVRVRLVVPQATFVYVLLTVQESSVRIERMYTSVICLHTGVMVSVILHWYPSWMIGIGLIKEYSIMLHFWLGVSGNSCISSLSILSCPHWASCPI